MVRSRRYVVAAVVLLFVAPLVAEFLLGDLPLNLLPALILMAPMYGGGAVLIREFVRRSQRGWPSILALGAAYALLEEGLLTQSLFNPDYLHLHMHFLQPAHVAWIGTGGWWTLLMLNLHTFWSMGVSIAVVEGAFPAGRTEPWLGRVSLAAFVALFLLGCLANASFGMHQNHFVAHPVQLASAGLSCIAVAVCAFLLPKREPRSEPGDVPSPWLMGTGALVLGAVIFLVPSRWGWGACAAMLASDVTFLVVVATLSRRLRWTPLHTLALAAGGALCYGIHAFFQPPVVGSGPIVMISHVVFLAAALALIAFDVKRTTAFDVKAAAN